MPQILRYVVSAKAMAIQASQRRVAEYWSNPDGADELKHLRDTDWIAYGDREYVYYTLLV